MLGEIWLSVLVHLQPAKPVTGEPMHVRADQRPGGHAAQEEAPAVENVPVGHAVGDNEPVGQNEPTGHSTAVPPLQ